MYFQITKKSIVAILLILLVVLSAGCGKVDNTGDDNNDNLLTTNVLVDDDTLKVELFGYGDNPDAIEKFVLEIYYKGSLIENSPYDEIIKSISDGMTGLESDDQMVMHVKLFTLDHGEKAQLVYEDDYYYMQLFWVNSEEFEAYKNYEPNPDESDPSIAEEESAQIAGTYNTDEEVELTGFVSKTWQDFPTWCLGLMHSIDVYDEGGAKADTITTNQIFFFDEDTLNGKGFDEYSDGVTMVTVRGTLVNYRDGGEIFITNPTIVE